MKVMVNEGARELQGLAASPGVAVGAAFLYRPAQREIVRQQGCDVVAEQRRLQTAIEAARGELNELRERTAAELGEEEAAIFDAHLSWLDDPELIEECESFLAAEQCNAETALKTVIDGYAAQLEAVDDPYFQARVSDLRDLFRRLLDLMQGEARPRTIALPGPVVVVAEELTPSDTMLLDRRYVLAFCTATGGATAHAAILARSLGIPAVVGLGEDILDVAPDSRLAVDGQLGQVTVNPDEQLVEQLLGQQRRDRERQAAQQQEAQEPALTRDGRHIEVVANIGSVAEAESVLAWGAEGVGLLRSEFLYTERDDTPTEEEQWCHYQAIADALGERPLIVRTLDIGGDKPVSYLPLAGEANPFLGFRAIRIGLAMPDLLRAQLRAILRASPGHAIKIMFPMIADMGEWRRARAVLDEARAELEAEGIPVADNIEVGAMIEVPSAALLADQLAAEVDFFSIGTNDLTQYTLAVDRTNERVAAMHDALHPAVLRLIRWVIDAAHARGRWVGLCGELAGDPLAAPLLLGLGLDEFSCAAPAVPALKARLRELDSGACQEIAMRALELDSPAAVRELLAAV